MEQASYELVSAVQDLYGLYQRVGPAGPYRSPLFHDRSEADSHWPPSIRTDALRLDELARGINCLLANNLAGAAPALLADLWHHLLDLRAAIAATPTGQPAAFLFITSELAAGAELGVGDIYRLYGEVLAAWLAILATTAPGEEWTTEVSHLRQRLLAAAGR